MGFGCFQFVLVSDLHLVDGKLSLGIMCSIRRCDVSMYIYVCIYTVLKYVHMHMVFCANNMDNFSTCKIGKE